MEVSGRDGFAPGVVCHSFSDGSGSVWVHLHTGECVGFSLPSEVIRQACEQVRRTGDRTLLDEQHTQVLEKLEQLRFVSLNK